jgi:hypothetical protein
MTRYTHTLRGQKAKAIAALPSIEIQKQKKAKTGTMDGPENLTANLTKNPVKTQNNKANSSNLGLSRNEDIEDVTSCNKGKLQNAELTRPAGLEPATFGFEVRDSIQLSYGRKIHKWLQYNNFLRCLSTLSKSNLAKINSKASI